MKVPEHLIFEEAPSLKGYDQAERIHESNEFFERLEGQTFDYYGACHHEFRIGNGGEQWTFEILEDPADGYRSYLGAVVLKDSDSVFYRQPIARIRLTRVTVFNERTYTTEEDDLWRLRDLQDDHVWLEFGTGNTNDYYPYFTFRHQPKEGITLVGNYPYDKDWYEGPH